MLTAQLQAYLAIELVQSNSKAQQSAQPVVAATLSLFSSLAAALNGMAAYMWQLTQLVELLAGVDLAGLILNGIFTACNTASACRCAAADALMAVVGICALLRHAADDAAPLVASQAAGAQPLPNASAATSAHHAAALQAGEHALRSMQPALCALLQHVVRNVGMAQQAQEAWRLQGHHQVTASLRMLQAICATLPAGCWGPAWADAVGIFWLTRLMRHPDTGLRCLAIDLLSALVSPAAPEMRSAVLHAWPEGGTIMLRTALSAKQPTKVAAAALRFVTVAMASSSRDVPHTEATAHGMV